MVCFGCVSLFSLKLVCSTEFRLSRRGVWYFLLTTNPPPPKKKSQKSRHSEFRSLSHINTTEISLVWCKIIWLSLCGNSKYHLQTQCQTNTLLWWSWSAVMSWVGTWDNSFPSEITKRRLAANANGSTLAEDDDNDKNAYLSSSGRVVSGWEFLKLSCDATLSEGLCVEEIIAIMVWRVWNFVKLYFINMP